MVPCKNALLVWSFVVERSVFMNFNIAIDGPAGAGKSTIARMLSQKLSYIYVDTGAMYRATALYYLTNNININDEKEINKYIDKVNINIIYENGLQLVLLNGPNVSELIRTESVSHGASVVSTYQTVRERMVKLQQEIASKQNVIMDGRDIGTVVLPTAKLKIFLTASVLERSKRRYKELQQKGVDTSLKKIVDDLKERDYRDSHRENSPLKQADDALLLDTTTLSIDEVVDKILEIYNKKQREIKYEEINK